MAQRTLSTTIGASLNTIGVVADTLSDAVSTAGSFVTALSYKADSYAVDAKNYADAAKITSRERAGLRAVMEIKELRKEIQSQNQTQEDIDLYNEARALFTEYFTPSKKVQE